MELAVLVGTGQPALGRSVAQALGVSPLSCTIERFPDGELEIELSESVRGREVFIIQPTSAPVGDNLLELLLLGDACARAGAEHTVAVVPYFGYARQDRRRREGQPHGARVVTSAIRGAGLRSLVTVDLHSRTVEGCLDSPMEHLTAVPLLAEAIRPLVDSSTVIVSPDFGAIKLAEAYAAILGAPLAIVHKSRLSGSEVTVHGVVGDVRGKKPIIIDDMISTGGTIAAAAQALERAGCARELIAVATHGLLVDRAAARLQSTGVSRLVTSDSVLPASFVGLPHQIVSLTPLLADAISRIFDKRTLADLLANR